MQPPIALNAEASVPISIPKAYGGMAECHGTLRVIPDGLGSAVNLRLCEQVIRRAGEPTAARPASS